MKIICHNLWISFFVTKSYREFTDQVIAKKVDKNIDLDKDKNGIYYYCIWGKDSLTQENKFSVTFSSDYDENSISFLVWDKLFILSTGAELFFIDSNSMEIKCLFAFFTPLIGLHITKDNNLVVLEELSCKILSCEGKIIKEYQFKDTIEDFYLKEDCLNITIADEEVAIKII